MDLREFLFIRKQKLLGLEGQARGSVKDVMLGQLQSLDAILLFLHTKQLEEDMANLEIRLDDQVKPNTEINARRQDDGELTVTLQGFVKKISQGTGRRLLLPTNIKPRSIISKIYQLRTHGKLPPQFLPANVKGEVWLKHLTSEELEEFEAKQKRTLEVARK